MDILSTSDHESHVHLQEIAFIYSSPQTTQIAFFSESLDDRMKKILPSQRNWRAHPLVDRIRSVPGHSLLFYSNYSFVFLVLSLIFVVVVVIVGVVLLSRSKNRCKVVRLLAAFTLKFFFFVHFIFSLRANGRLPTFFFLSIFFFYIFTSFNYDIFSLFVSVNYQYCY